MVTNLDHYNSLKPSIGIFKTVISRDSRYYFNLGHFIMEYFFQSNWSYNPQSIKKVVVAIDTSDDAFKAFECEVLYTYLSKIKPLNNEIFLYL